MHTNFCQAYHELVQEATLGKDLNSKPRGETRRFLQTAYVEKAVSCKYKKICSGKDSAHEVRVDVEKYLANNDLEQGKLPLLTYLFQKYFNHKMFWVFSVSILVFK